MKVNGNKTQMLCINACIHNKVTSNIVHQDLKISSTDQLELLGFVFDSHPNANKHVEMLVEKFYSRLWTLRFLKKSGLEQSKLLEIYNSVIRSAIEYCANVYHSMITKNLSEKLESMQRQALRIIYGWDANIEQVMAARGIETLFERREKSLLNFALKNEHKERYGKRWFKETTVGTRTVREGT